VRYSQADLRHRVDRRPAHNQAKDKRLQKYVNKDHERRVKEGNKYPLSRPSFPENGDWKLAPLHHILGLRHFAGSKGEINTHIINELHVSIFVGPSLILKSNMYLLTFTIWDDPNVGACP
jgi:hypothetical protein